MPHCETLRPIVLQRICLTPGATRPEHADSDNERPGLPRLASDNLCYVTLWSIDFTGVLVCRAHKRAFVLRSTHLM